MTPAELAIVTRCARAVCAYCANPEKWQPAALDEGDYYHKPALKWTNRAGVTKGRLEWCDASLIWWEFEDATPETRADGLAALPLFAQEAP